MGTPRSCTLPSPMEWQRKQLGNTRQQGGHWATCELPRRGQGNAHGRSWEEQEHLWAVSPGELKQGMTWEAVH